MCPIYILQLQFTIINTDIFSLLDQTHTLCQVHSKIFIVWKSHEFQLNVLFINLNW